MNVNCKNEKDEIVFLWKNVCESMDCGWGKAKLATALYGSDIALDGDTIIHLRFLFLPSKLSYAFMVFGRWNY